jgi:hypothetical protein
MGLIPTLAKRVQARATDRLPIFALQGVPLDPGGGLHGGITGGPQGCFKMGVLRTPGWEAAVGDGFAGPPPYRDAPPRAASDRGLPGPDLQGEVGRTLKQPCPAPGLFQDSCSAPAWLGGGGR